MYDLSHGSNMCGGGAATAADSTCQIFGNDCACHLSEVLRVDRISAGTVWQTGAGIGYGRVGGQRLKLSQ